MEKYLYDMHVHTEEVSWCAHVDAATVVRTYKENGYTGIVITDHFFAGYFDGLMEKSWAAKVDRYLEGYRIAKCEGDKLGLKVLLGVELRFPGSENDFLVYGITEEFIYNNPEPYEGGPEGFRRLTEGKDILIYQAHPFRNGMTRANPKLIDGVEVFNCCSRHESYNSLALQFALKNGLKMISGGDFHMVEDVRKGGLILNEAPENSQELVGILNDTLPVELFRNI